MWGHVRKLPGMSVDLRRLRAGEWLAGAGAAIMAVALFAHWYGPAAPGGPYLTGWAGIAHLRWVWLVAIAVGLALVVAQAACRAPALPASLSVISTVIALIAVLTLLIRVVIDPLAHQRFPAWLEFIGACALLVGSFGSLRQEGIRERDGPGEIPVIDLAARSGS